MRWRKVAALPWYLPGDGFSERSFAGERPVLREGPGAFCEG